MLSTEIFTRKKNAAPCPLNFLLSLPLAYEVRWRLPPTSYHHQFLDFKGYRIEAASLTRRTKDNCNEHSRDLLVCNHRLITLFQLPERYCDKRHGNSFWKRFGYRITTLASERCGYNSLAVAKRQSPFWPLEGHDRALFVVCLDEAFRYHMLLSALVQ
jgi:hypothetical protein